MNVCAPKGITFHVSRNTFFSFPVLPRIQYGCIRNSNDNEKIQKIEKRKKRNKLVQPKASSTQHTHNKRIKYEDILKNKYDFVNSKHIFMFGQEIILQEAFGCSLSTSSYMETCIFTTWCCRKKAEIKWIIWRARAQNHFYWVETINSFKFI